MIHTNFVTETPRQLQMHPDALIVRCLLHFPNPVLCCTSSNYRVCASKRCV